MQPIVVVVSHVGAHDPIQIGWVALPIDIKVEMVACTMALPLLTVLGGFVYHHHCVVVNIWNKCYALPTAPLGSAVVAPMSSNEQSILLICLWAYHYSKRSFKKKEIRILCKRCHQTHCDNIIMKSSTYVLGRYCSLLLRLIQLLTYFFLLSVLPSDLDLQVFNAHAMHFIIIIKFFM